MFSDYIGTWPRIVATVGGGLAGVVFGPVAAAKFIEVNPSDRVSVAAGVLIAFVFMPLLRQVLEALKLWSASDTFGWIFKGLIERWFGLRPPVPPAPPAPPVVSSVDQKQKDEVKK